MKESVPLLILDLDETLIYGQNREGPRLCDFPVGPFYVYKRPHLDEFLRGAGKRYRLAIWSSASSGYVAAIARTIVPFGLEWAFVWSRDRCTAKLNAETFETEYIKNLKKVKRAGFDLARILVVDDTRHTAGRNYGNAIYVAPFEGDPGDEELPLLLKYLESLVGFENFRVIEKRGWRRQDRQLRCRPTGKWEGRSMTYIMVDTRRLRPGPELDRRCRDGCQQDQDSDEPRNLDKIPNKPLRLFARVWTTVVVSPAPRTSPASSRQ